jgi:hypothetical protein
MKYSFWGIVYRVLACVNMFLAIINKDLLLALVAIMMTIFSVAEDLANTYTDGHK